MSTNSQPPFSYSSLLLLFTISLCAHSTSAKSSSDYYTDLKRLCFTQQDFESIYGIYSSSIFSWLDLFFVKIKAYDNYLFKPGSTYLLKHKYQKSYYMSYSANEAIDFYLRHFNDDDYVIGSNSSKTLLTNPDARDYLVFLDNCYLKEVTAGYNYLHYTKEFLHNVTPQHFDFAEIRDYYAELFSLMYQLGRGLLYLFQHNHYSIGIALDNVKTLNPRDMNVYKLADPLHHRSHCDLKFFPEFVTKSFTKILKSATKSNVPQQLQSIRRNLNICGNINIKQFLVLIEQISAKFPFQSNGSFLWKNCFVKSENVVSCPGELKASLRMFPGEANMIIKTLNGEHYENLSPADTMKGILRVLAFQISKDFDFKILEGQNGSDVVNKEG